MKNPEYWDGISQAQAEADSAVEAAKSWDDGKVAPLTKQFVFEATSSREAWEQAQILKELGERTHPTVLGFLRDSSLYDRLVKPTGKDILPEAPFNRACDLLGDSPEAEAVEVLVPFLGDPSKYIRTDAALAIAKTGAATITPLIRNGGQRLHSQQHEASGGARSSGCCCRTPRFVWFGGIRAEDLGRGEAIRV